VPKKQNTDAAKARAAARKTGGKYTTALRAQQNQPLKAAEAITPKFLQSCTDPKLALDRACEIMPGSGGAFWDSVVRSTLQAYLVAAAVSGATPETLARWVADPDNPAPAEILRGHPEAPEMYLQFEAMKGDGWTPATVRSVVRMAVLR
jgi:hypothetical protein